jgi:caa(3)-type oxidase subunit IV
MHSDVAEVKKSVRTYMMVFGALMGLTIVTVAAASLDVGVGLGVAIALAIAATKGSLVAAVFMHLSHEKRWIYGTLILTVVFFVVLLLLPVFTTADTFGTHIEPPPAAGAEHAGH